jgi:hypothetical protein
MLRVGPPKIKIFALPEVERVAVAEGFNTSNGGADFIGTTPQVQAAATCW